VVLITAVKSFTKQGPADIGKTLMPSESRAKKVIKLFTATRIFPPVNNLVVSRNLRLILFSKI
jgi:hypothetical protein